MDEKAEKLTLTALIAAGTALWGWLGWLVILWVGCMVLDYVSGSAAAIRRRDWNSQRARDGLWHKAGQIMAVAVAALCDSTLRLILNIDGLRLPFDYTVLITPVVLAWYILTELGSIMENAALLGAPVPRWLTRVLKITAEAVDKTGGRLTGEEGGGRHGGGTDPA